MIENRHNNTENQTTTTLYCFRKIEKLKQIDIFCIYNHILFGMINKLQHEVREVWKYILTEKKQVSLRRCFQKIYDFSWGNTSSYYPHRHAVNVLYNLHVSCILHLQERAVITDGWHIQTNVTCSHTWRNLGQQPRYNKMILL